MEPSTGPLLHRSVRPASTAEMSFLKPAANFFITDASHSAASYSHPSSFSPSSSRTILANSCVRRLASARAASEAHSR